MASFIWISLGVVTYVLVHVVLERTIFHFVWRMADPVALRDWDNNVFRGAEHRTALRQLGWLEVVLREAVEDGAVGPEAVREEAARGCYDLSAQTSWPVHLLSLVKNTSMMLGLLGTALCLWSGALGATNPMETIGLGIGTTVWGIAIAIPALVAEWLFGRWGHVLQEQLDRVIEEIESVRPETKQGAPLASLASAVARLERFLDRMQKQQTSQAKTGDKNQARAVVEGLLSVLRHPPRTAAPVQRNGTPAVVMPEHEGEGLS